MFTRVYAHASIKRRNAPSFARKLTSRENRKGGHENNKCKLNCFLFFQSNLSFPALSLKEDSLIGLVRIKKKIKNVPDIDSVTAFSSNTG